MRKYLFVLSLLSVVLIDTAKATYPDHFENMVESYIVPKREEHVSSLNDVCMIPSGSAGRRKLTGWWGCEFFCNLFTGNSKDECKIKCAKKDEDGNPILDDDDIIIVPPPSSDDDVVTPPASDDDDDNNEPPEIPLGCNAVVYEMIREGFKTYSKSTKVQAMKGLQDQALDRFLTQYISSAKELTSEEKSTWVENVAKTLLEKEEQVLLRTIGCDDQGSCTFNLLMAQHHIDTLKTDFFTMKLTLNFKFAPNILIIRETSVDENGKAVENDVLVEVEKAPMDDIDQLLMFMEIVAYDEIIGGKDGNNPFHLNSNKNFVSLHEDEETDEDPFLQCCKIVLGNFGTDLKQKEVQKDLLLCAEQAGIASTNAFPDYIKGFNIESAQTCVDKFMDNEDVESLADCLNDANDQAHLLPEMIQQRLEKDLDGLFDGMFKPSSSKSDISLMFNSEEALFLDCGVEAVYKYGVDLNNPELQKVLYQCAVDAGYPTNSPYFDELISDFETDDNGVYYAQACVELIIEEQIDKYEMENCLRGTNAYPQSYDEILRILAQKYLEGEEKEEEEGEEMNTDVFYACGKKALMRYGSDVRNSGFQAAMGECAIEAKLPLNHEDFKNVPYAFDMKKLQMCVDDFISSDDDKELGQCLKKANPALNEFFEKLAKAFEDALNDLFPSDDDSNYFKIKKNLR